MIAAAAGAVEVGQAIDRVASYQAQCVSAATSPRTTPQHGTRFAALESRRQRTCANCRRLPNRANPYEPTQRVAGPRTALGGARSPARRQRGNLYKFSCPSDFRRAKTQQAPKAVVRLARTSGGASVGSRRRRDRARRATWSVLRALAAGLIAWLALAAAVGDLPAASAQESAAVDERLAYQVKAAHLYGFGLHVSWPDGALGSSQEAFKIGVLGKDPFGDALDVLAKKRTIRGRPIRIERFATPAEYRPVQILFLPAGTSADQTKAVLAQLGHAPVLVVGESPGLAGLGAALNFFIEEGSVRFEVNLAAAAARGLEIKPGMLKSARMVKAGEAER